MSQYLNAFPSLKYRGRNFPELQVDGMGWLDEKEISVYFLYEHRSAVQMILGDINLIW